MRRSTVVSLTLQQGLSGLAYACQTHGVTNGLAYYGTFSGTSV